MRLTSMARIFPVLSRNAHFSISSLFNLPFCCYLNLNAPNLRVFCCQIYSLGLSCDFTLGSRKCFVCLDDTHSDEHEDIVMPFGSIPSIKHMDLNGCFVKVKTSVSSSFKKKKKKCMQLYVIIFYFFPLAFLVYESV